MFAFAIHTVAPILTDAADQGVDLRVPIGIGHHRRRHGHRLVRHLAPDRGRPDAGTLEGVGCQENLDGLARLRARSGLRPARGRRASSRCPDASPPPGRASMSIELRRVLGAFVQSRVLVPAGSEDEKEIRPQFESGASIALVMVDGRQRAAAAMPPAAAARRCRSRVRRPGRTCTESARRGRDHQHGFDWRRCRSP